MGLDELFRAFSETNNKEEKARLFDLIREQQIKQEQAMIAVMYPKGDK